MNKRIKELRKKLKLTQANFGKQIGLKATAIGMYESGDRNITEQTIKLICREFNVNEEWLRNGKGEMFKKEKNYSLDEFLKKRNATPLEIEFMKIYFSLDETTRKKIISDFKKAILEQGNELSTTKEMSLKPAYEMTDKEIDEEVEAYRQQLILEKTQEEKSSVFQKNELA